MDTTVPSPARVYDYWLGGGHNFAPDRMLAEKILQIMPGVRDAARLNRSFLRRAALHMVENGVRQFLDIGSGIPTVGNLHEIVQAEAPDCRVVYVDRDPVAVAHSELILAGNGLNLLGVGIFWQTVVQGAVLVAAVAVDMALRDGRRGFARLPALPRLRASRSG